MSIKLLDLESIDINNIVFSSPEKIKGSFHSFAKYNDNDIYIKTPVLKNVSNIVKLESRCYIEVLLDLNNNDEKDFYDLFTNIDDNNILTIHKNSQEWFKKQFPLEVIEDLYLTPLKHKTNKLKIKIPIIKNKIDCLIYDRNNNIITNFSENNNIIIILKFNGLKFLSQQVISEWVPIQIKTNEIVNDHNIKYLITESFNNNSIETDTSSNNTTENTPESVPPNNDKIETELIQSNTEEIGQHNKETIQSNTVEIVQTNTVEIEKPNTVEIEKPNTVEIVPTNTVEILQTNTEEIEQSNTIENEDKSVCDNREIIDSIELSSTKYNVGNETNISENLNYKEHIETHKEPANNTEQGSKIIELTNEIEKYKKLLIDKNEKLKHIKSYLNIEM